MKRVSAVLCYLALVGSASFAGGQAPSRAATPPMGWNSWNHFAEKVNDADVRAAADALVASGMRDAGYVYVNIDDTWQGTRDAQGVIHPNAKFPDMKALADYVHSRGLKLGIYSSPGPKTCANYEGSYGHEKQDAAQYAAWGIDFLKYDQCSFGDVIQRAVGDDPARQFAMQRTAYETMQRAIQESGRPMVYSFCQYGLFGVWAWGPAAGANLWRTTGDISDNWDRMTLIGFAQDGLERFAGPGHWNDPDMLEVGNGGMSTSEYQVHMSLWAMLAAPLLAGNDLSKMSAETKNILLNKDAIAIDQDVLGRQGHRIWVEGPLEIWERELSDGGRAVALFNRGESQLSFGRAAVPLARLNGQRFRSAWDGRLVTLNLKTTDVPRHAVLLLRSVR